MHYWNLVQGHPKKKEKREREKRKEKDAQILKKYICIFLS